jgi:hypothetical protein
VPCTSRAGGAAGKEMRRLAARLVQGTFEPRPGIGPDRS